MSTASQLANVDGWFQAWQEKMERKQEENEWHM